MSFKNTRLQGASGDAAALAYFAGKGYPVAVPFSDGQRYDLVVDIDSTLHRVECKTTTTKNRQGNYTVELRTSGGNRSGSGRVTRISTDEVELVTVLDGDGGLWVFKAEEVAGMRSLALTTCRRHAKVL